MMIEKKNLFSHLLWDILTAGYVYFKTFIMHLEALTVWEKDQILYALVNEFLKILIFKQTK